MTQNEFESDVSNYSLIIMKISGPDIFLRNEYVTSNQSETIYDINN